MSPHHESFRVTAASLAGVRLFEGLPGAAREAVAARCDGRRYPAGAMVVASEDPGGDVFFILSGTLRAHFFSGSGKEVSFRDQQAGEMFGEISAIDGRGRSANVTALVEASLARLTREAFLDVVCSDPSLAHSTLRHMAHLVRSLSERVVEFGTLGVRNRIHAELLRLATHAGVRQGRCVLDPAPRHTEIASRVSTHREAVSREFGELHKAGLLDREGTRLVLHDVAALERLVRDMARASAR